MESTGSFYFAVMLAGMVFYGAPKALFCFVAERRPEAILMMADLLDFMVSGELLENAYRPGWRLLAGVS